MNFLFMITIKYLKFDEIIQKRIKTNNPQERYIEEIKRRIIPMRSSNNFERLDRLSFGTINVMNVNLREGSIQNAVAFQQLSKEYEHCTVF